MALHRDLFYGAGLTLTSPIWGAALLKTGKWRTDWPGRFGRTPQLPPRPAGTRRVLFHAVSVGEVNQIRSLVDWLAARDEPIEPVIATTTNTGFARATSIYGERFPVLRYPFDFSAAVRRFLDAVQPDAVALVELEVWPNFVEACTRRDVPVAVINGRLSERSFGRYRKVRCVLAPTFARLAAAGMQTDAYAERIAAMGVPAERVSVLDTLKWDTATLTGDPAGAAALREELGMSLDRPVVVLGSTGDDEEKPLADAVRAACGEAAQLLIVPRKPERFDEVAGQFPGIIRRSAGQPGQGDVYLLDTMGELRKAYELADVVIVGRSFNGWGGSDPIEPAALGRATLMGPDHQNFSDVVAALEQGGGIRICPTPDDAGQEAAKLLADREAARQLGAAGQQVVRSRQGATQRYGELLLKLLGDRR